MPTRRSPAPLSEFTEAPLLRALKGGRIGVSVKGGQAKPLADALTSVSNALAKATTDSERNRLTSIQKILTALQTQAEAPLRQLPPTERGLASLGKAAALKREKRAVEDPKNPSGHFVKRLDPSEMSPADAAAARSRRAQQAEMEQKYGKFRGRQIFDLPSVQPMKRLNPREAAALGSAAKSRQGPPEAAGRPKRRLIAGSEYARRLMAEGLKKREVAAIRPEPLSTPEEYLRRRLAEGRLYRESLAGSPDRPSAIENLQPERFGELRQEAAKIVRQAGDRPAKATAKDVKAYNAKVQAAVKPAKGQTSGEISKELGDTLRNRLIEGLMTSGSGDAVLAILSNLGGKGRYQTATGEVKPRVKSKGNLPTMTGPQPKTANADAEMARKRTQAKLEGPSRRGGASVRLPKRERVDRRALAAQLLQEALEGGRRPNLTPKSRPYVPSTGGGKILRSESREMVPAISGPEPTPAPAPRGRSRKRRKLEREDGYKMLQRLSYRGGRTPFAQANLPKT